MKHTLEVYVVTALIAATSLAGGCGGTERPDRKTQWGDPKTVQAGPVLHDSLTSGQMERVRGLQKIFSEVDPSPVEKWAEDFRRDLNPERELSLWEGMASVYASYMASRKLTLDAKKEVFQVVLMRSATSEEEALAHLKLKVLTEKDARVIMGLFTGKPQPVRAVSP